MGPKHLGFWVLFALSISAEGFSTSREISTPQISRTSSRLGIQFNAKTAGDYRVYSGNNILCHYGNVQPGVNRILLPKIANNEPLYVKVNFAGRAWSDQTNDIRIPARPYFSPHTKVKHASAIYQLPIRTYFAQGIGAQHTGRFRHITAPVLQQIRTLGVDYLWLTGVLEHAHPRNYDPDGIKGQAGSYYAITDNWDVSPDLGTLDEFEQVVRSVHASGMRVLIDLIPNHTARVHATDVSCKESLNFGRGDSVEKFFDAQNNYFYLSKNMGHFVPPFQMGWPGADGVFDSDFLTPGIQPEYPAKVTGNDLISSRPPLDSWFETVKLNYGYNFTDKTGHYNEIPKTWLVMLDIAKYWLAKGVDGFRVDFAHAVPLEFWQWFIRQVKIYQPNAFMVAEAYEQDDAMKVPGFSYEALYSAGFDSVYNSRLYWSMRKQAIQPGSMYEAAYINTPAARPFMQKHGLMMTNYIENHDELRVAHEQYSPQLSQKGERMRQGWSQFAYSALLPAHILVHGGQELGEDAAVFGPFAKDNGRTSIFDYVYQTQTLKWLQGKLDEGATKLRAAYAEVLRFKKNSPFLLPHASTRPTMIDLSKVNSWKDQNRWVASYLRFDNNSAFLVVTNSDPLHAHPVTVHFTNKTNEDPIAALRASKIKNSSQEKYIFVEVLSRRGWIPNDPNISGTGVPGDVLYRNAGVPSGFHIGQMPPRTTYVFKIVPFGEFSRSRP